MGAGGRAAAEGMTGLCQIDNDKCIMVMPITAWLWAPKGSAACLCVPALCTSLAVSGAASVWPLRTQHSANNAAIPALFRKSFLVTAEAYQNLKCRQTPHLPPTPLGQLGLFCSVLSFREKKHLQMYYCMILFQYAGK